MVKKIRLRFIILIMLASTLIAGLWDSVPMIKDSIHFIFDPTAGILLKWNLDWGMVIIVLLITLIMTLVQKYTTDQNELKRLKGEQKKIQEEMKQCKDNPQKMMELQKQTMPMTMEMMKHSMQPLIYTAVPIVLFFRWFNDYFVAAGDVKIFGLLSWFWFYLLASIVFSIAIRKLFKVE